MAFIREILVPTDFSRASKRALQYACEMAEALGASLHVLHVVENPYVPGGYMQHYPPPASFDDTIEGEVKKQLDAALTAEERAKYHPVLAHRTGLPPQEILGYLRDHPAIGLVVMATHGRGGVRRFVMGSVADQVVRTAPCPVLTLRATEKAEQNAKNAA